MKMISTYATNAAPPRQMSLWAAFTLLLVMATVTAPNAPASSEAASDNAVAPSHNSFLRGVWISRFNWESPDQIPEMFDRVKELGLTDIFWQVRGNGTVLYPSDVELVDDRVRQAVPPYDPLAIALEAARERGLRLHAWMNVMPGWRGPDPPRHRSQLWNAHPDWFMGRRNTALAQGMGSLPPDLSEGYVFVNPSNPAVRSHIAAVAGEIARKYAVDGVHFDYIRFPGPEYGYDRATIDRFGDDPAANPQRWNDWRRAQLTELVREATEAIRAARPEAVISAATWGNSPDGQRRFLQDQHEWLARGYIDFTTPMVYNTDAEAFTLLASEHFAHRRGGAVAVGLGNYLYVGDADTLAHQVTWLANKGGAGYVLFDYGAIMRSEAAPQRQWLSAWNAAQPPAGPLPRHQPTVVPPVRLLQLLAGSPVYRVGAPLRFGAIVADAPPDAKFTLEVIGADGATQPYPMDPLGAPGEAQVLISPALHSIASLDDHRTVVLRGTSAAGELILESSPMELRPAHAEPAMVLRGIFGQSGEAMRFPLLVPSDMLWVSVQNEDRLAIFNPQGQPLPFSPLRMGKDSTGADVRIIAPSSLILSADGEVLALCETPSGSRVLRFTRTGQPQPGWELPFRASTMTIDSQGRLYIVEAFRRRWHIYTEAGEKIAGPFAPRPSDRLSLEAPVLYHGIAIANDEHRVYVGSPTLRHVDVYERIETNEGEPPAFRFLNEPLCTIGPFPGGIDRAPDGRIFVSDSDHLVRIFSADGSEHLGDLYSDFPPLRAPQGVAFLPDGSGLFVAAHGGGHAPSHLLVFRQPVAPAAEEAPEVTETATDTENVNEEVFPVEESPAHLEPGGVDSTTDAAP